MGLKTVFEEKYLATTEIRGKKAFYISGWWVAMELILVMACMRPYMHTKKVDKYYFFKKDTRVEGIICVI